MGVPILISHAHADDVAAATLAEAIERVSLRQLSPWYSSDTSGGGGLRAGDLWMRRVLDQLNASRAVISLVTPRSANQPWLLFEAGFAAARDGIRLIPVTLGLSSDTDLPGPLAGYQVFQLTDAQSLTAMLRKLLSEFDLAFDEEMAAPVIRKTLERLAESSSLTRASGLKPSPEHEDLKRHFDRRLTVLAKALVESVRQHSIPSEKYDIPIQIQFRDFTPGIFVSIEADTTIRDVLDSVFFALGGRVMPFTYLENWILQEETTGLALVAAEAAYFGLASSMMPEGTTWVARPLESPYQVTSKRVPSLIGPEAALFLRMKSG
jgi:hypothetical protein